MFWRKREVNAPAIPPVYYHVARNMRGRYFSSDAIRQMLIRKGLSWEKTFFVINQLDTEDEARVYRHPLAPRSRAAMRRRIMLAVVVLGVSLTPIYLDALPGLRLGLCATVGLFSAMMSLISLILYTLCYAADYY